MGSDTAAADGQAGKETQRTGTQVPVCESQSALTDAATQVKASLRTSPGLLGPSLLLSEKNLMKRAATK